MAWVSEKVPGNRWVRAALQVNPYDYVVNHRSAIVDGGHPWMESEDAYNRAFVDAANEAGIGLVGLTDHFCAISSERLRRAFETSGIAALPGFEAKSAEGVHLLCLFSSAATAADLEHLITEIVGAKQKDRRNATSNLNVANLTSLVAHHGGITLAAHCLTGGGLLHETDGQTAILGWKAKHLLGACIDEATPKAGIRKILANSEAAYKRDRAMPLFRSADVAQPEEFHSTKTWTWLKVACGLRRAGTSEALETVRQAALDPELRLALVDPTFEPQVWIRRVEWVGSALFSTAQCDLNPGTNVLIGGRGR